MTSLALFAFNMVSATHSEFLFLASSSTDTVILSF
jgi:hypothetical protein